MARKIGIFIAQPGKSVLDENLKPYEQQLMSTRGALLEKESDVDNIGSSMRNHGSSTGIPLVLIGKVNNAYPTGIRVGALTPASINNTQFSLNGGFETYFYRIFYNESHP